MAGQNVPFCVAWIEMSHMCDCIFSHLSVYTKVTEKKMVNRKKRTFSILWLMRKEHPHFEWSIKRHGTISDELYRDMLFALKSLGIRRDRTVVRVNGIGHCVWCNFLRTSVDRQSTSLTLIPFHFIFSVPLYLLCSENMHVLFG